MYASYLAQLQVSHLSIGGNLSPCLLELLRQLNVIVIMSVECPENIGLDLLLLLMLLLLIQ